MLFYGIVSLCCILTAVFSFFDFSYSDNERIDRLLTLSMPLVFASVLSVCLLIREKSGLFRLPKKLVFALPCLLVAVNNFPFCSYLSGKSVFADIGKTEVAVFTLYCALVGFFEECVFRGVVFALFADRFSKNHKGVLLTFFSSSVTFGFAHVLNLFTGASPVSVVMQIGYSVLIGGLCAYALLKTKNIIVCAFVHALYDFCGLLLDGEIGLGTGIVFDFPTIILTVCIGVAVASFVLYEVFSYSEEERVILYRRLGFGVSEREDAANK